MTLRTYEILAKWIARKNNLTIKFEKGAGARVNMKTREITLSNDLDEKNCFVALTYLIHEAGHLLLSDVIPLDLVDNEIDHMILNSIEDVRVDNRMQAVMPNFHDFYEEAIKFETEERKNRDLSAVPTWQIALVNTILRKEGFFKYKINHKKALELAESIDLPYSFDQGIKHIFNQEWDKVKQTVKEIRKNLNIPEEPEQPKPNTQASENTQAGNENKTIDDIRGKNKVKAFIGSDTCKTVGSSYLGEVALEEITKQAFKEALNINEIKEIDEGTMLDTDNLTDFITGNIEGLFKDELIEKRKKSMIHFLLDASGSMGVRLLDDRIRKEITVQCVRSLIAVLNELQAIEGLNIDYAVSAFNKNYYSLNTNNWEREYSQITGGTDLINPFKEVINRMKNDNEIEGKKIIIVITDGDVYDSDVQEMKQLIIESGGEIKTMVVTIGAKPGAHIIQELGDFNILAEEASNSILMEAITETL